MAIHKSNLLFAMDRIDDFGAVHAKEDLENKLDALEIMLESIGLDDSSVPSMINWIQRKHGHGQEGGFILGVIIGIMAHQHMIEKDN
jgi:hypothetical protein